MIHVCQGCGENFLRPGRTAKYCTKKCYGASFSPEQIKQLEKNLGLTGNPEDHPSWSGNIINYNTAHQRLKKLPKPQTCQHCGRERKLDWASKSHFSKDDQLHEWNPNDWLALCKSCHRKYDMTEERLTMLRSNARKASLARWGKRKILN